MKLKSLNRILSLILFFVINLPIAADEKIDIWNKQKKEKTTNDISLADNENEEQVPKGLKIENINNDIEIQDKVLDSKEIKIFGIYDPAENDFNLNMWSKTDPDNVKSIIKRINKIKLSSTAEKLFENTLLSFAYPPKGMSENDFLNLKINWMIDNKKTGLIEKFLNQNNTFPNKKKLIQHLVDNNIAKANIKEGCEKINFLDKDIKDIYLDKFKIYCLVYNKKNIEAQLQLDILREEKRSDSFFDNKIDLTSKKNLKKLFFLILISYTIFLYKNVTRINQELKIPIENHHNFENFPFFWIKENDVKKVFVDGQTLYKVNGSCWNTKSTCIRSTENLKVYERKGYLFYKNE